jgi:probable HAF family extracellular repeat protein
MRSKISAVVITVAAVVVVSTVALSGQTMTDHTKQLHYSVHRLDDFGGTASRANSINNKGWITGWSLLPGDATQHATLWRNGVLTDLGTLGGLNSQVEFPDKNTRGAILGGAETSAIDPFSENFCNFGTNMQCLPFMWRKGAMVALPTLGGNNGYAMDFNDRGQAVGMAENATPDPNCTAPQVFDFEAVMWDPNAGTIQELPPVQGDSIGAALAINRSGQAVGMSGFCQSPLIAFNLAVHATLWPNGPNGGVIDLGTLGGAFSNGAFYINNRGQIVGISDLPGDATGHAFLWQNGVMQDLGTLPGDFYSVAYGINDSGQVVGQSCDVNFNCRAFLWQHGLMMDLNSLVPENSGLYLVDPADINAQGEIAGQGYDPVTGEAPAFLAVPDCDSYQNCDLYIEQPLARATPRVSLPENIRGFVHGRMHFAHR